MRKIKTIKDVKNEKDMKELMFEELFGWCMVKEEDAEEWEKIKNLDS